MSINFAPARAQELEDHDKFVICQVPCYTVLRDGMIVVSGNDRPTPSSIFLVQTPALIPNVSVLCFLVKVPNSKIYSGLYECAGHIVLYLVLVKIGKPTPRCQWKTNGAYLSGQSW